MKRSLIVGLAGVGLLASATWSWAADSGAGAPSNAFNPAIGLILSGTYGQFSQDPEAYRIPGFALAEESTPGERGFSLGESELAISANIDPDWYGMFTLALEPSGASSVENAYVQTTGLGNGLTVRGGRFYSGIGYLNSQHAHQWDFVDTALPYRAMLGTQFADDGIQVRWLAPTDIYTELGVEGFRGDRFPGGGAANQGRGAWSVFVHVGDDVGVSHSWRAGLSYLSARSNQRATTSAAGEDLFTGTSRLLIADFVWKWAPNGNPYARNFKLQGEYLRRREEGEFTPAGASQAPYSGRQSGWYLQGVYQFMPRWRVGLRHDQVHADNPGAAFAGTVLDPQGQTPKRNSVMVDYANSEFSRLRMQYNRDQSGPTSDNQWYLQYVMSLGAHGAHNF